MVTQELDCSILIDKRSTGQCILGFKRLEKNIGEVKFLVCHILSYKRLSIIYLPLEFPCFPSKVDVYHDKKFSVCSTFGP